MPTTRPILTVLNNSSGSITQLALKRDLPIAYVQRLMQQALYEMRLSIKALQKDIASEGVLVLQTSSDKAKLLLVNDMDKLTLDALLTNEILSRIEALEVRSPEDILSRIESLESAVASLGSRVEALETPAP